MSIDTIDVVIRLSSALLLGMSLGIERAIAGKTAGVRTHSLVAMGSALFIITSILALGAHASAERTYIESIRIIVAIVSGIGFLGAGLFIFNKDSNVGGMTTAAGIWVAAGVGIAVGYGLYTVAIITTIFTLIIFTLFWYIENKVKAFGYHVHKDSFMHKSIDSDNE